VRGKGKGREGGERKGGRRGEGREGGKGRRERSPPPLSKFLDPPLLNIVLIHALCVKIHSNMQFPDRAKNAV